jgi:hypothetical protein
VNDFFNDENNNRVIKWNKTTRKVEVWSADDDIGLNAELMTATGTDPTMESKPKHKQLKYETATNGNTYHHMQTKSLIHLRKSIADHNVASEICNQSNPTAKRRT